LLLGALLAASDGSVVQFPADDSGSVQCGPDQVTWSNMRSFSVDVPGAATFQATAPDGSVVVDLAQPLVPGEKLVPLWCGDLLGDGSQVVGLETFSGGAHCCFSVSVVRLAPGASHLLDADLGNGGLDLPQQLDGTGALELVGSSDVFAYFDDLSFAASPFMPLVYAFDGEQYVEATRQFPDRIQAEIDQAEAALTEAVARPTPPNTPARFRYQEQESVALRLYGLHVLLGDADAALPLIQRQVAPPVASWLATNAPAAEAAMANVYNLSASSPTSWSPSK
jgi:hypothetical protein